MSRNWFKLRNSNNIFGANKSFFVAIGFNVESVPYKGSQLTIWDVGAQPKIRPLWRHYTNETDVVIWVVDSNDRERFAESRDELHKILSDEALAESLLLVIANKQDMPFTASVAEVTDALSLFTLKNRQWYIQSACGMTKPGLEDGNSCIVNLNWIVY